jgi:hypothetical protein
MSTAPDMLRQFGGAPVGNYFGWKNDSSVYFVDGTLGTTGGSGTSPDDAVANISEAITLASEYDVIYVLEHGFSGTDPVTYAETVANLTIPLAKDGLAIVGVTHQSQKCRPLSPYVAGMAATATPILTINAPLCSIENLAFTGGWNNATTCTAGIYLPDGVEGTAVAQGVSIYNCSFEDMSGTASYGGVYIRGEWYANIVKTYYRNCVYAINWGSSSSTAVALYVDDVNTYADTAAKVASDIYCYAQGTNGILIKNANFAHPIGTATGISGTNKYIACVGAEVGLITGVRMASASTVTIGVIGTGIVAPSGVRFGDCYDGTGLLAVLDDS